MSPKNFNWLVLAAIVSLVVAGLVHGTYNDWSAERVSGKKLLPTLSATADEIGQITLVQGDKTLTLNRSQEDKGWALAERNGYPLDNDKVRTLVFSLAKAELVEPKTRDPKRYGLLELQDPKEKDAKSKLVRLSDYNGRTIAEVIVGKQRHGAFGASRSGTYLRQPGDEQTWLANADIKVPFDISDWTKPGFFRADSKEIVSLEVKDGDKTVYKLAREKAGGELKVTDIPADKKVKATLRTSDLLAGIQTLEMLDVRQVSAGDKKPDMTAVIETKEGAKFRIGLKKQDKDRWVTVSVLESGKDKTKEAAEKIGKATKGWAFKVADWRANQTFKEPKDIFEDKAPKKDEAGGSAKADGPALPKGSQAGN